MLSVVKPDYFRGVWDVAKSPLSVAANLSEKVVPALDHLQEEQGVLEWVQLL